MSVSRRVLWVHPDPNRYFLLPEGFDFPAGDFALFSLEGEELHTRAVSLQPFEVTWDEAQAALGLDLEGLFEPLRRLFEAMPQSRAAAAWQAQGVSSETAKMLGIVQSLLEGIVNQDEAEIEHAQAQLRQVEEALHAQGLDEELGLEQLPEQLAQWYATTGDEGTMRQVGSTLLALVGDPQDETMPLGQRIDEAIARLEQTFGRWIPDQSRNQARFREERQRRVREGAKRDIDIALRAHGVEPVDFSHLFTKREEGDDG